MPLLRSRVLRPLVLVAAAAVVFPLCGVSPASAADEGQSVVGPLVQDQVDGGVPAPAVVQPASAAPLAASAPTNQVTVVMAVPAGGTRDTTTLAGVVAAVNGPVAQFWSDQSHGSVRIEVAGQVDWPAQPFTSSCANPTALLDDAQAKSGFVPGPGKHLLVYSSVAVNCGAFFAETGSGPASGGRMLVRQTTTAVIAHTFGTNFGLPNAAALQCDQGIESGSCSLAPGAELYDVMGNPQGQVGALIPMEAAALGFLDADPYTVRPGVEGSSYQSLRPYGDLANGDRALRVVGSDGSVYWLEYRTPVGQDAWLGDPTRNLFQLDSGVLIRRETRPGDPGYGYAGSLLLDATPSPSSFGRWGEDWQQALPVGAPVRIDGGKISISVLADGQDPAAGVNLLVEAVGGADACAVPRTPAPLSGVALLDGGATTRAYVVGGDRAVWSRPVDGPSAGWQSLGGGATYGPAAARAGTTSYVFVVGLDHGLWYRSDSGSGWSSWSSLGGYLTASPAAASLGSGEMRVFGRGSDGSLWSRELRNGVWSPWTGLGGNITAPPTATADTRNGRIVVLVRGVDGYQWEQALAPGSGPVPYQWVGVAACSSFAMGAVREGNAPTHGVYLDWWNRPIVYNGWSTAVGGTFSSNPAVTFFSGGNALVAGRGTDGALWVFDTRTPGGPNLWNHSWQSLGGYIL